MALIKCPMCQKDVSSMVSRCPFCNADLTHIKDSENCNNAYYKPDSESTVTRNSSENRQKKADTRIQSRAERQADAEPGKTAPLGNPSVSVSGKRKTSTPPAGSRLLGYRSGNPFYMFISVFYQMTACVGILYAFSLTSRYWGSFSLLFHISRVLLAAIMLYLPVLLLSENQLRRNLPLLRSRNQAAVFAGFVILYIPLLILFSICWYFCM